MSHNAGAVAVNTISSFQIRVRSNPANSYTVTTLGQANLPYQFINSNSSLVQVNRINLAVVPGSTQTGNYFSGNASITMSVGSNPVVDGFDYTGGYDCNKITSVVIKPEQGTVISENYSIDSCRTEINIGGGNNIYLKLSGSGKLSSSTNVTSYYISIRSEEVNPLLNYAGTPTMYAYVTMSGLDVNFNVSSDSSTSGLGEINQSINNVYNEIQNQNNLENEAIQNISGQTVSDIPNATNAQTTSLLGVISSFIGALTSIDTTGNCQLTLPFPEFVGGDTVVNPCNGKDKAPAIVQVFSSLFLIGIFVPLAWLLIRMIYKEIRTWTNG